MPRLSQSVLVALRENKTPKSLKLVDTIQGPQLLLELWYAVPPGVRLAHLSRCLTTPLAAPA